MKIKVLGLAIASIVIYSCASKQVVQTTKAETTKTETIVTEVAKVDTPVAVTLTAEQEHGKGLYEQNCAKCHKLFEPASHNPEEWKVTLARMQKKAKTSDEDTAIIYNYLTAGM
jgi:cytochrome c5